MTDIFDEGGWTMYPTALFGALTVLVSLVLAVRPERRFVSLSALTVMTGVVGVMWGLTGMVKAATNAAPQDLQTIVAACATQALNSLLLAFVLVVVATLGATSGALRVAIARREPLATS
jgi:predicted lysophospholipase L1 biosynthesis ABC-type transport system permease subunit